MEDLIPNTFRICGSALIIGCSAFALYIIWYMVVETLRIRKLKNEETKKEGTDKTS